MMRLLLMVKIVVQMGVELVLALCITVMGLMTYAQNGLEKIFVERYYVADAVDAANSHPPLPVGSVTYRIYADMLPGYKVQSIYGSSVHTLTMTTTTTFFNNEDYGSTIPTFSSTNAKKNTVMLDSWLSTGGACNGYMGIPKADDNGVGNFVNSNVPPLLQNNVPQMSIPLTTQDGMYLATVPSTITLGLDGIIDVFGDGSVVGNSFVVTNGAWSCLSGAAGPIPATNKVLIAQITTDGTFHFELNIQIGTPTLGTENYVCSNPGVGELTIPSLIQTLSPNPAMPTVSITSPANNATFPLNATIPITAVAADADGTVSQVEFFVDGVSIGIDQVAPYTASFTGSTEASHVLTAKATDNEGFTTVSAPVNFTVANAAPTVSIIAPAPNAVYIVGDIVTINATSTDPDGTIASLQIYVDGVAQGAPTTGTTQTLTATANYTSVQGVHTLTAKATDNNGKSTTSSPVTITVNPNQLPNVTITDPVNGATPAMNSPLTVTANASDPDGTVVSVEFFSDATSLGLGTVTGTNTYSVTYTPTVSGQISLTAKATDNKGGIKISTPVVVTITDFSTAYLFKQMIEPCSEDSVCMPISTVSPVSGIGSYAFTIKYDKLKVAPTGVVNVSTDLISPSILNGHTADYVTDYTTAIDANAGTMDISIIFNSNAGSSPTFTGSGDVCCVGFVKTTGFQIVDTAVFKFNQIVENYPGVGASYKTGSSGKFISFKADKLNASLKFWSDMSPIKYDETNPSQYLITNIFGCNQTTNAVNPDLSGNFVYSISNGTTVDIKRDIANTTNVHSVTSAQDAYLAALVANNATSQIGWTPSVYQMIAMDVNRDGQVNSTDADQIAKRAVRLIPEFTQTGGLTRDWSFLAKTTATTNPSYAISATFPGDDGVGYSKSRVPVVNVCQAVPVTNASTCPIILGETYIGIMISDVDSSYAKISPDGVIKSMSADTASIVIDLRHANTSSGTTTTPVYLSTFGATVHSFDFDLLVNDQVATVSSATSPNSINLNANYVAYEKELSVASYSLDPIPVNNTMSIAFTLTGTQALKASDLTGALALINGKVAKLIVLDPNPTTQLDQANNVSIYPNPASDKLNVQATENCKFQMTDLNGKNVLTEKILFANQKQVMDLSNLSQGIYLVKVYNDKFVTVKKLVIKK